jgi:HPt (histidine-containing phosphotransfer) domain-containing protein
MSESRTPGGPMRRLRRTGPPADRSEKLRRAFLARLRNDRVRLTILAAELTRGADTAHAFDNLRLFAHEVRGAAAACDASEVDIAAHALERAAAAAMVLQAENSDVDAWAALEALRDLLGSASSKTAAS